MTDKPKSIFVPVGTTLEEAERRLILATLHHHDGNKVHTARSLGVALKTLYNKLNRYQQAA